MTGHLVHTLSGLRRPGEAWSVRGDMYCVSSSSIVWQYEEMMV